MGSGQPAADLAVAQLDPDSGAGAIGRRGYRVVAHPRLAGALSNESLLSPSIEVLPYKYTTSFIHPPSHTDVRTPRPGWIGQVRGPQLRLPRRALDVLW